MDLPRTPSFRLDGKRALVSGAGRGIGLAAFIEQTGVRFRPYVLWQRMERAVAEYAAGATLTDAAYAGGFADSAHFSRTFRRMFGLPAAALRIE